MSHAHDQPQDLGEFARLVEKMRHAQKRYFQTRSTFDLETSKSLERQVDRAVAEVLDDRPTLFPMERKP